MRTGAACRHPRSDHRRNYAGDVAERAWRGWPARHSASIFPAKLLRALSRAEDDEFVEKVGVHWATEQVRDLIDHNVRGVHFYTLNKSKATLKIYETLGVRDSESFRNSSYQSKRVQIVFLFKGKGEFPHLEMTNAELVRIVEPFIEVCHRIEAKGFVAATDGNISARLPNGNVLITPASMSKAFVGAD